jgi:hypothetical protein
VVLPEDGEPIQATLPVTPITTSAPLLNFFILSANAIALLRIVGLTLYLLDGGAERLMRMWWGV